MIRKVIATIVSIGLVLLMFTGFGAYKPINNSIQLLYPNENLKLNISEVFKTSQKSSMKLTVALKLGKVPPAKTAALYSLGGEIVYSTPEEIKVLKTGEVSVKGRTFSKIAGIMLDYPGFIGETYKKTLEALKSRKRIMVVYLDGFGFDSYEYAKGKGIIPNLAKLKPSKVATVYPSITPVSYAAMISGEAPFNTGITDRSKHTLKCKTIFDEANKLGKTSIVVEGDMQILNLSTQQELNTDTNANGLTDDEVLASALSVMSRKNYDLVFIHFHGIDDTSHIYGPKTKEVMTVIKDTDKMIATLTKNWKGSLIVTADHGQHNNGQLKNCGSHGTFTKEDMYIPLLTGGQE